MRKNTLGKSHYDKPYFGGQAVVEGVLMKGASHLAIAVRKPNKTIKVKLIPYISFTKRVPLFGMPFFRGIVSLFEMLVEGMKALTYSANEAVQQEDEQLSTLEIALTLAISIVFSLLLFVVAPYLITHLLGITEETQALLFNLVDGLVKLCIFVSYIIIIGLMKDVHRIFQYHGAEHKAINCFEAGKALTAKQVQQFSTIHPRCGTSFILLVIVIGIFIFSLAPFAVSLAYSSFYELSWVMRRAVLLFVRILFMLPIAGASYEVLKLAGKYRESLLLKMIVSPGLLVQKLTTKEPDDKQVEVSIAALKAVLHAEHVGFKE